MNVDKCIRRIKKYFANIEDSSSGIKRNEFKIKDLYESLTTLHYQNFYITYQFGSGGVLLYEIHTEQEAYNMVKTGVELHKICYLRIPDYNELSMEKIVTHNL